MRDIIIPMEDIKEEHRETIGGKAYSLHQINRKGFKVPEYLCVTTKAYERFLDSSGLKGKIVLELARKDFTNMRWEEMWDTALRIRNFFLKEPIPEELAEEIRSQVDKRFRDIPVVVRSSAPGEDSSKTSFAGLHESYVNVRGVESIIEHVKLVWASLWSDSAILYRKELGLDIEHSSMAVMIQKIIVGERSGIVFSTDPNNRDHLAIEAVHGLNKGLVDGDVEPDRWIIDRQTSETLQHVTPSSRDKMVAMAENGTVIQEISGKLSGEEPLKEDEVRRIYEMAMFSEETFGSPQDMEWTIREGEIYLLQSRPITTLDDEEERKWYISLKRTFDNLKLLHKRIENELIPQMTSQANSLSKIDISGMEDTQLADEILRRKEIFQKWDEIYTKEFIPFAHGMRLFGQVYNDTMKPSDPYEFIDVLTNSKLMSIQRNMQLYSLADMLRKDNVLKQKVESGSIEGEFERSLNAFMESFGKSTYIQNREGIIGTVLEIAANPQHERKSEKYSQDMEKQFLSKFRDEEKQWATELLEIGRASYRLRDDDNIYIGSIEGHYLTAIEEGKLRLKNRGYDYNIDKEEILKALRNPNHIPKAKKTVEEETVHKRVRERQVQGQPAGKGLVRGVARVIGQKDDLFKVKSGEILVCDAIDPNMTFVVPLAAGIVERRGGMLIHGAIIAREYGIPCVTGIPDATKIIETGDEITVDGYLGIVVIHRE